MTAGAGAPEDADRLPRERALVLALGAAIALAYLAEYVALPFLDAPLFDAAVYVRQARSVLAGRFGDPTLVAFSPLFGWFGAALGAAPLAIVVAQLGLFVLDGLLLHRIASRFAPPRVALAAPLLFFGYGLVLSYASKLTSESLGLFFTVLATERITSEAFARGERRAALVTGLCFALAVLARASLIFTLPFVVIAAFVPFRSPTEPRRVRVERAGLTTLGIACILLANGLWNLAHTGLFVPVIAVSRTIEQTTSPAFDGRLRNAADEARTSSPWDVVRQVEARIEAARRGEPDTPAPRVDALGALRTAPKKLALTFGDTELTFDYPYYGERALVRTLGALPFSFGALLVLGVLGAIAVARRSHARTLVPLMPFVLGVVAVTTLYYPSSRYRLAIIVPLLAVAPAAIEAIRAAAPRPRVIGASLVGLALAFFVGRTYAYEIRQPGVLEAILAEAYARAGDGEQALRHARRALELEPDSAEVRQRLSTFGRIRDRATPSPAP